MSNMPNTENPQPLSGMVVPRFGEVATFMRLPIERDPAKLDIALVGVPFDGGTTNRPPAWPARYPHHVDPDAAGPSRQQSRAL
jgi:hypothetical protein